MSPRCCTFQIGLQRITHAALCDFVPRQRVLTCPAPSLAFTRQPVITQSLCSDVTDFVKHDDRC